MKTIKQKVLLQANPASVYKALMNSKEHSKFTESEVNIKDKAGSKFTAYDGYIEGKNIELVKGKKIVQNWKANESNWPEGHYSLVTFNLKKKGNSTELNFIHSEVPSANAKSLSNGWKKFYWAPMKEYFKNKEK